ncbi:MAG: hypothetical protein ACSLE6_18075 [Mycobacterium sp.]
MKLVNNQLAVKVRLTEPTDNGFLVLAAEIGGWAGPLALRSRARRRLLAPVAALCEQLAARDEVAEAIAFRGVLRPPGEGSEILNRTGIRPARYDLVVLVRTTTVEVIDAVRTDAVYREIVAVIAGAASHTHLVAAGNAARIADVDHGRDHWFLFNYFHCDDAETVYDVWEYTAGWFQNSAALPDSTLMRPLAGEPTDYSVINHASWPTLGTFLPSLAIPPQFPLVRPGQLQSQ